MFVRLQPHQDSKRGGAITITNQNREAGRGNTPGWFNADSVPAAPHRVASPPPAGAGQIFCIQTRIRSRDVCKRRQPGRFESALHTATYQR